MHPYSTNTPKRQFRVTWGGSGAFVAKKSDATLWHDLLQLFGPFCTEFRKAIKQSQMHPNSMKHTKNISLGSNGVDRVRLLRKITTQLCGTNFCTCSSRFAPSFVRQPNGPQCTQIEQNAPKLQFRVQWVGSGEFAVKNSDATSCTNFCTSSARFAPSFIMQPNGPQYTQIEQNTPKH